MKLVQILFFLLISIIIALAFSGFFRELEKVENNIGKSVVLNGDTLLIIDISIINGSYILENGTEINFTLPQKIDSSWHSE